MKLNPFDELSKQLSTEIGNVSFQVQELEKKISSHENRQDEQIQLLTTQEVCDILKISRVTVWNYEKKGILRPTWLGTRKRYRRGDILAICKQ